MRVVSVRAYGGPDVLELRHEPDPVAGDGEVLIDVEVADVLLLDARLRSGWGRQWFDLRPPYVPGAAVAGRVGPEGRRVVAHTGSSGGYATRVAVPSTHVVPIPDGVSTQDAAALATDGVTATALSDLVAVRPGERVLITAAAGGMGVLLVQLMLAAGAEVVGAVRGDRKLALVRGLGAEAVDYSAADWADRARAAVGVESSADGGPAPAGFDVVLDGVGGSIGQAAFELVVDGGRMSAHGAADPEVAPVDPAAAARRGVRLTGMETVQFEPARRSELIGRVLAEAAAGRVRPVIGRTFPLADAAMAHKEVENRTVAGKTLLLV
ncbi:zinc-binding dehydrogenase [Kutzneria sp. NPDC052558]|uniref:zinc-binding dehydrogenase n=1 Tax=Kutzneria sp. NPDC052558 TaxID=3364121 RepID=UPI0037C7E248